MAWAWTYFFEIEHRLGRSARAHALARHGRLGHRNHWEELWERAPARRRGQNSAKILSNRLPVLLVRLRTKANANIFFQNGKRPRLGLPAVIFPPKNFQKKVRRTQIFRFPTAARFASLSQEREVAKSSTRIGRRGRAMAGGLVQSSGELNDARGPMKPSAHSFVIIRWCSQGAPLFVPGILGESGDHDQAPCQGDKLGVCFDR